MAFSSNTFLFVFLPLVFVFYYLLQNKLRPVFLLLASFVFFAWSAPKTLLVLLFVIFLSYSGALLIDSLREEKKSKAKLVLIATILIDVGILTYFKYTNFIISCLNQITDFGLPVYQILQPVGISFFTFQSIGYLVEVYRGKVRADKNLLHVSLFFAMFPKLAQGPIMRYGAMQNDLLSPSCSLGDVTKGIRRFIIGLTKKLLIADTLGHVADQVFSLPASGVGTALAWGGVLAYTLQIYYDFSGYSDMAVGIGRMLGYHLTENFDHPYISVSVTEFWRRWHISLSTWFRDFIYIPLGGGIAGETSTYILV